ncbi:39S ribosomal protein L4, mitochondrial-like isoform X2 [Oncorhynchus keta]|uniref:39S ribosomal protein L4, mitochondrial-like isoform X2 n=1 Tax=Oncorhynchus keta TaxID=8018 RepID=UPI00227C28EE|nr:39S ribosomal protein L4, mitochondrial-like isoform X2 [Oncorhynchus keta]XP_052383702.1 39S ribosomal protein L4, mitochondrial-like isoform X2 [Oncorhynchus keta]
MYASLPISWTMQDQRPPPPSDSRLPVLGRCDAVVPVHLSPVQTWVETLERQDSKRLGLVDLHPDVFAVPTRWCFSWTQRTNQFLLLVSHESTCSRAKNYPQLQTGLSPCG